MATNLNISENQERVPLTVGSRGVLRSITPDSGSPYYVGARAYVTQTASGAIVTVIDKEGTTTATILNGTNGQDGADGNGIASIDLTSSVGNVDTYTITYDDGTTDTFEITNGVDGVDGTDGVDGVDGFSPTATVTKSGDTATITITDKDGTTTASISDGSDGASAFVAEFGITPYADVKDAYDDDAILICTVPDGDNTMTLQLVYFDDTNEIFFFAFPTSDGWYWTQLSNADGWDDGQFYFASTDVATQLRDGLMSALDWQKLDGIASGAEVNVQSDWNQSVNTADDYIKNKPTIPSKVSDLLNDSGFITSPNVVYCTCSTASGTAAKVATIESGSLTSLNEGDQAIVKFTNANGKANPTLKIGNTEAKSIMRYGTTAPGTSAASSWNAGSCVLFTYDGTYWQMANYLNTTYSEISEANITNGSGSSSGLVTGRRAKKAVETFAPVKDVTVDGTSVLSGTTAAIDLSGKADASHTHTKSEITDFPALAAVATTGNYNSLTDKPTIHNVPSGGSSGQVLSKASGTDYDLAWVNQGGGGGSVTDVEVDGTSVVTGGVAEIDLTGKSDVGHTHTTSAITDFPTIPSDTGDLTNGAGFLDASGILNLFYPVGSYYETSDTSFNPNVSWGGTWVLETEGQVHISAGANYTAGDTGGATTSATGNHTLTATEIPAHTHGNKSLTGSFSIRKTGNNYNTVSANSGIVSSLTEEGSSTTMNGGGYENKPLQVVSFDASHEHTSVGGGGSHNHGSVSTMQPYIVVNRWHRTA